MQHTPLLLSMHTFCCAGVVELFCRSSSRNPCSEKQWIQDNPRRCRSMPILHAVPASLRRGQKGRYLHFRRLLHSMCDRLRAHVVRAMRSSAAQKRGGVSAPNAKRIFQVRTTTQRRLLQDRLLCNGLWMHRMHRDRHTKLKGKYYKTNELIQSSYFEGYQTS